MPKFNVKQMHALVDELADAGNIEMLTALHTIMLNVAKSSADDDDLEIDDDEKPKRSKKGADKSKKTGRRARSADNDDDDGEDDGEGDDDDLADLEGLDGIDVDDDEDEKPKRGKKVPAKSKKDKDDEDDGEDDAGDDDEGDDDADAPEWAPGKKAAATFEKFLDEVDEFEFEPSSGGVRELSAAIQAFGINPKEMDFGISKKLTGKDLRKANQEAYAGFLAKLEFLESTLVEADEASLEKVADHYGVDTETIKGRGKAKAAKIAKEIIGAIYAPEDEGDDE